MPVCCSGFTRRGGLVRPASKSDCFSHHPLRVPKAWHRDFAACGQRSGLLALNLASIFEKLLEQKTFILPAAHNSQPSQKQFAPQMWAARPHLGSIFEKLLHRKTFICLRLAPSSPIYIPLTKKSRTYRPALPHAAFALIRFFRTIQPVNHLPASASDNLFQSLCS